MKLIFQLKHIDGQSISYSGGFAISKDKINIRFVNGPYVSWKNVERYRKITKKL